MPKFKPFKLTMNYSLDQKKCCILNSLLMMAIVIFEIDSSFANQHSDCIEADQIAFAEARATLFRTDGQIAKLCFENLGTNLDAEAAKKLGIGNLQSLCKETYQGARTKLLELEKIKHQACIELSKPPSCDVKKGDPTCLNEHAARQSLAVDFSDQIIKATQSTRNLIRAYKDESIRLTSSLQKLAAEVARKPDSNRNLLERQIASGTGAEPILKSNISTGPKGITKSPSATSIEENETGQEPDQPPTGHQATSLPTTAASILPDLIKIRDRVIEQRNTTSFLGNYETTIKNIQEDSLRKAKVFVANALETYKTIEAMGPLPVTSQKTIEKLERDSIRIDKKLQEHSRGQPQPERALNFQSQRVITARKETLPFENQNQTPKSLIASTKSSNRGAILSREIEEKSKKNPYMAQNNANAKEIKTSKKENKDYSLKSKLLRELLSSKPKDEPDTEKTKLTHQSPTEVLLRTAREIQQKPVEISDLKPISTQKENTPMAISSNEIQEVFSESQQQQTLQPNSIESNREQSHEGESIFEQVHRFYQRKIEGII